MPHPGLFEDLDPEDRAQALLQLRGMVARRRTRAAQAEPTVPRIVRTEKRCPRCSTVRPVSEFGVVRSRPDGLHGWCRWCR